MNNWFSVGEEIILQSKERPEDNGEYTVREIIDSNGFYICRITGAVIKTDNKGVGYILEEIVPEQFSIKDGVIEGVWSPRALRKKYKGCGQDYNEMIKSLNIDIVEVV